MSPVEQYTIDCEYLNKKKFKKNSKEKSYKKLIMQLFSADATMFFKNVVAVFFFDFFLAKNRLNIHNQLCIALLETLSCATSI